MAEGAARLLRTLREMATGAREQLRDGLGPEFADVDLRNLNARTVVQRAVFGNELDLAKLNPRTAIRNAVLGDEDLTAADPRAAIRHLTQQPQPLHRCTVANSSGKLTPQTGTATQLSENEALHNGCRGSAESQAFLLLGSTRTTIRVMMLKNRPSTP